MRIQDLAIIFIIIILPISIILGAYTQMQISTISLQTEYDMKLTAATSDAIKAFQINTANSSTSDIANSKIRDIEASVSTFKASIKSVFGMNGYSEDEMNEYIPALVYTMYDGFYIYSKFNNQNYLYQTVKDNNGNETYVLDNNGNKIPIDNNEKNIFGLKPYITYSAEYVRGNTDVVITYSLDNHISIKGIVDGAYWDKSGYLIDGITDVNENANTLKYNGVEITKGTRLKEYLPAIGTLAEGYYEYIRYNGTKYYLDSNNNRIIYFLNGNLMELKKPNQEGEIKSAYLSFKEKIDASDSAYNYYKEAYDFSRMVKESSLKNLTYADAQDYVIKNNGETEKINIWSNDNNIDIFDFNSDNSKPQNNIECEKSNFNQHRLVIIKNKIRTNLAIAIANFNSQNSIEFQMPELSEEDWAKVMNNIAMISFVQGIEIGGKTYNGYTIVNNSESKEVVREENIYILGVDGFYHRIGDEYLAENENNIAITSGYGIGAESAGRLNLDFNRQMAYKTDGSTMYYYPLKDYYASYNSVVNQNYWDKKYDEIDDIYAYVAKSENGNLKKAFYTALGRERYGMYKSN